MNDKFDDFADDLLEERSIRPLIIIGASKVDDLLFEILKKSLRPKIAKASDSDELLENDRPLSTFSARTLLCYRLGLIDKTLFAAIDQLRKLRNLCAHQVRFDHEVSPIRDHLAELRKNVSRRESYKLTQKRYNHEGVEGETAEIQCLLLTICVLLESISSSCEPIIENENAIAISSR